MLAIANWVSVALGLYVLIGIVFSLWFVTFGVRKEPIEGKAVILRLMLLPGALLLWPLLLIGRRT